MAVTGLNCYDLAETDVRGTYTIVPTTTPNGLDVNYTSADSEVATVDENGMVTGVKGGNTTITIMTVEDGIHAVVSTTIKVTVNKLPIEIEVDETPIKLDVDCETTVSASLNQTDAGSVSYNSNNNSIVTVDKEGNIKAIAEGKAVITVYYDGNDYYNAAENKSIDV